MQAHYPEGSDEDRLSTAQRDLTDEAVLNWRFDQFRALGFDEIQAVLLAQSELDLHVTRSLIAQGCPPSLAIKIAL